MREIVVNTLFFVAWLVLTAVLTRTVAWAGEEYVLRGWQSVLLWMAGQVVILSPLIGFLWKNRHYDWER